MWTTHRDKSGIDQFSQAHPTLHWERFLSENAPRAICLHGPEEGNLLHFGIELARRILCELHSSCGLCSGCKSLQTMDQSRFFPLFPASQVITIESVRELLDSQGHQLEKEERQVFLICFPSQMNKEAANALLKNLEEPSPGRVYLLINPFSSILLPTISSRLSHIYLPGAKPDPQLVGLRSFALKRLCDFDLFTEEREVEEVAAHPVGLSAYFRDWTEGLKNSSFSVEELLFQQLRSGIHRARRKVAVCSFVEDLGVFEHRFLESELEGVEAAWKKMDALVRSRINTLREERMEEIGKTYRHWLLKDFKNSGGARRVDQFLSGLITREIERILREVCILFDSRDLFQESALLQMEQQIRRNYASLYTPHGLYDLHAELSALFQMLRSNVGWKEILEQCGFLLLRFREGRSPVSKLF